MLGDIFNRSDSVEFIQRIRRIDSPDTHQNLQEIIVLESKFEILSQGVENVIPNK